MDALLLVCVSGGLLLTAYFTVGRWVARRVFTLREDSPTPAVVQNDGRDYCPTSRTVVFGHHFTSIAGTGPIVGPAIAVMWGWLPAVLWILCGGIFLGAIHDFGALVISLRNKGRSVGDIAGDLLGARARLLFLSVLVLGLWIVLAIFGLVIASVLRQFPAAIFPVLFQIPLSIGIGLVLHRAGRSIVLPSVIALALMYASVVFGDSGFGPTIQPLHDLNQWLAAQPLWAWTIGLLAYCYIASVLPVWLLLQPRDYINALQLVSALGLIVLGLVAAAFLGGPAAGAERPPLEIVAPIVNLSPAGAPPIVPMLFITIACGAISGFHCLVSSGTTSKQLRKETDAQAVGYGSMLTESFLAILVVVACTAGIGLGLHAAGAGEALLGQAAFDHQYQSWGAAGGLASTVGAFVQGSANLVASVGVPAGVAVALMGVLVASFAGTTMDTACRLQRYVIQELASTFLPRRARFECVSCGFDLEGTADGRRIAVHAESTAVVRCPECGAEHPEHEVYHHDPGTEGGRSWARASVWSPAKWLSTPHGATIAAVVTAAALAAIPARGQPWSLANAGKGGMILWPLFGATNQLLGGLAFIVLLAWLRATGKRWAFLVPGAALMLVLPAWAMAWQAFIGDADSPSWVATNNWLLVAMAAATLALEAWLIVEAALRLPRMERMLTPAQPA